MAWNTPRTWSPGETVTAALLNAQIRDNLNLLKTSMDDNGFPLDLVKGFAYSAGQANAAGSGDTQLTSYDVTIPANLLAQPGDCLILEGTLVILANADAAKMFKVQIASGTLVTLMNTNLNVASHIAPFRYVIRRRTSVVASITGLAWLGAASGAAATAYLVNVGMTTVDFTVAQTLKLFANSATVATVRLTDYHVLAARGALGSVV